MFDQLFERPHALARQRSGPLNTTNIYAAVDLEMKAKALATCEVRGALPKKHWRDDVALLQFLRNL